MGLSTRETPWLCRCCVVAQDKPSEGAQHPDCVFGVSRTDPGALTQVADANPFSLLFTPSPPFIPGRQITTFLKETERSPDSFVRRSNSEPTDHVHLVTLPFLFDRESRG